MQEVQNNIFVGHAWEVNWRLRRKRWIEAVLLAAKLVRGCMSCCPQPRLETMNPSCRLALPWLGGGTRRYLPVLVECPWRLWRRRLSGKPTTSERKRGFITNLDGHRTSMLIFRHDGRRCSAAVLLLLR